MRICRHLRSLTALAAAYALALQPLMLTVTGLAVGAGSAVALCVHDGPVAPPAHSAPCPDCPGLCLAGCCAAAALPGAVALDYAPGISPVLLTPVAPASTFVASRFAHPARAPPAV